MPAPHGKGGGSAADPPLSKIKTWASRVALELKGEESQQDGFTGARRAEDQHVADVADVGARGETASIRNCTGVKQRRPIEMIVAHPARPRRLRAASGATRLRRVYQRLTDIGVEPDRAASDSQASTAFRVSRTVVKPSPFMILLDPDGSSRRRPDRGPRP